MSPNFIIYIRLQGVIRSIVDFILEKLCLKFPILPMRELCNSDLPLKKTLLLCCHKE